MAIPWSAPVYSEQRVPSSSRRSRRGRRADRQQQMVANNNQLNLAPFDRLNWSSRLMYLALSEAWALLTEIQGGDVHRDEIVVQRAEVEQRTDFIKQDTEKKTVQSEDNNINQKVVTEEKKTEEEEEEKASLMPDLLMTAPSTAGGDAGLLPDLVPGFEAGVARRKRTKKTFRLDTLQKMQDKSRQTDNIDDDKVPAELTSDWAEAGRTLKEIAKAFEESRPSDGRVALRRRTRSVSSDRGHAAFGDRRRHSIAGGDGQRNLVARPSTPASFGDESRRPADGNGEGSELGDDKKNVDKKNDGRVGHGVLVDIVCVTAAVGLYMCFRKFENMLK